MSQTQAPGNEDHLEDLLSEPTAEGVETLRRCPGDLMVLGAAGKMGPSLSRMAQRAAQSAGLGQRVFAVSRFTAGDERWFQAYGIETIRCDLLDEAAVARLPDAANVIYMAGRKFGSTENESLTWAMNTHLPAIVCRRFRDSRIVAFSTGNVYPLVPATTGGSSEDDAPQPVGEYAMSCLGRERMFEHFSTTLGIRVALIRLNYACDLRYGVLVDLARKVWAGEPIDLSMGCFNTIWQGDANAMSLRALEHTRTPPWIVNVTGPERLSVRVVCERLGELLQKPARFIGVESETAFLSDARRGLKSLGPLRIDASQLIEWVANWISRGGRHLDKPTHFDVRDGRY